ncbi:DNA-binding transcriptional activator of the SARP family [Nonomuraea solani]|uniref:DNA-binding transcriptional activator of the SARP family n=1 Tax=Nonomuraea solani TaxID=1144553 RepID=A0A1H6ETJ2_9ACTN|nr:BTAD domain-containing putative transcriptional regulator [Nonomuraea solani]SEH01122.1 DNA-binding transcriptional activator of the SARP family [Nonomuraea solani]
MRFILLGPVHLVVAGEPLTGIAPRHRAVLAYLLLNAGRVISIERLIEAMWGHDRPDTARSQIHASITAIRKVLRGAGAEGLLETRTGGYVAHPGPGQLDAREFTELVAAGRLREALELWHGEALEDVQAHYAGGVRELWNDRRLSAYERLVEAELAAGRHDELLDELAAQVSAAPLREKLNGHLVLALHRAGRQADALAVARAYRTALADEQGLDPGHAFTELEHAVLTDAPALRLPPRPSHPPQQAALAGDAAVRLPERAPVADDAASRLADEAASRLAGGAAPRLPGAVAGDPVSHPAGDPTSDGPERVVPVEGPGLRPVLGSAGRSTFLPYDIPDFSGRSAELERLAGDHPGAAIVTIDGMAGIGKTTLAVHAAHRLADRYPDGRLFIDLRAHTAGREPVDAATALEALLRQLGVPADRIPAAPAERGALWRAELAGRRVLAVLDNASDTEHVRPLLPGHSDTLVLITSRRRLVDLDGAHALSVDVLDERDAAGLFGRIVGERAHHEPDAVHEVLRLCGHLPLAIRISAARLQHRPRWTVSYLAGRLRDHRRLLDGVSAAFTLSYEQLDEAEQRMFRLLGLVPGRDIDACGAAALAETSEDEAEDLLEGLLDAHMLLQLEPGRYTFHDLLREHARSLAEDDGAVMRLLGYYLHRSRAAMDRLFPHSVAQREGIPRPAAPIAPLRDAAEASAWLDAERANIIATAVHGPEICLGFLALSMRPFLDRQAHHDDAITLHTLALQRSRRLGDRAVQARALTDLAWTYWRIGEYERAEEHAHQALDTGEEAGERARALLTLGHVALRRRADAQAERYLEQALDLTRIGADTWGEAHVLGLLALTLDRAGRPQEARRHLDLALALHRKVGNPAGEAMTLNHLGVVLRHQGELAQARARHEQAAALYRSLGNPADEAAALNGLAEAAGDPALAVEEHTAALALADRTRNRPERARAHDGLARAHLALGHAEQAGEHGRLALTLYGELGVPETEDIRAFLKDVAPS